MKLQRLVAALLLVIPAIMAGYGFLKMKDSLFQWFSEFGNTGSTPHFLWFPFSVGLLFFIIGFGFIGGWIFFRDRKRNYVATRFKKKRKK